MRVRWWIAAALASTVAVAVGGTFSNVLDPERAAIAAATEASQSAAAPATEQPGAPVAASYDDDGFRLGEAGLTPSARAGREIWYKATAGNDRFHTYVFQQRVGVMIDWFRVLRSDERSDRFAAWGLINDPGCCAPGSANCPAKSPEETYGFDWCPGDETLLQFVGKPGYRDPACEFKDAPLDSTDVHAKNGDQRQSACDLKFGTSTGALGFRKFPNPKFDKAAWAKVNGNLSSWQGYNAKVADKSKSADGSKSNEASATRLQDGSIEPPFLIGTACGSCHIAFDPLNPPEDPANPKWENIKGLVGNQYTRISEIMVSGMPSNTLEWQMFAHARPGTSDTSAIPTDQVNNPGTINALINMAHRPVFENESIIKWRKTDSCGAEKNTAACWCEPGRNGKCWTRGEAKETVHHILKGGEDSIGALEAIQRVYFNIGSCSEQCWVNHLSDLRQIDPQQRGFGQTPFNIGQCRRDCPNFRAIEDRLANILAFFMSSEGHATDLQAARQNERRKTDPKTVYTAENLAADLEQEFGKGAVARGEKVYAAQCARCHSSQPAAIARQTEGLDFRKVSDNTGLREDFLSNDRSTPASEVGTFRCRALHSNHMAGRVWHEYGSETLRARKPDPNIAEVRGSSGPDGRTFYRNISLLNAWAHAPFMHNNAIGPELCGNPLNKENDFYGQRPRYVDASNIKLLAADKQPGCFEYDPSVEGRYKLYRASMESLLNPDQRVPKVTLLNEDVVLRVGPRLWDGTSRETLLGFQITIPSEIEGRGVTAGALGNFQHKQFVVDLVQAKVSPDALGPRLTGRFGPDRGKQVLTDLQAIGGEIVDKPGNLVDALRKRPYLVKEVYSSCTADIENAGHRFGEDLSASDKNALIAFLATL
jgi:hypothetical protein